MSWLLDMPGKIIVFGDIGSIGTIRYGFCTNDIDTTCLLSEVYIIFLSVVLVLPIRGGLTLLSIDILKKQPVCCFQVANGMLIIAAPKLENR